MDQFFQIQVNGEARRAHLGATVAQLLRELEIRPDRVVVELNLEILERPDFERRPLRDGDRVEIISFIGGGSLEIADVVMCPFRECGGDFLLAAQSSSHQLNESTNPEHGVFHV